jgi:hypothetical protein
MTPEEKQNLLSFIEEKKREANVFLKDAVELAGVNSGYATFQRGFLVALGMIEHKVNEI